jgi:hypothetical protein
MNEIYVKSEIGGKNERGEKSEISVWNGEHVKSEKCVVN